MKKILNVLLIAAITSLVVPQIVNADETLENKSTETTGESLTTGYITAKVKAKLAVTEGIQSNDINVSSEITKDGKTATVTLSGTQDSKKSVKLAGLAAKEVDGVAKVKNNLKVSKSKG